MFMFKFKFIFKAAPYNFWLCIPSTKFFDQEFPNVHIFIYELYIYTNLKVKRKT